MVIAKCKLQIDYFWALPIPPGLPNLQFAVTISQFAIWRVAGSLASQTVELTA